MSIDPIFTVVIPTYNRSAFIKKAIESVLIQTFPNFEIIVVDDGSTDGTENIVMAIRDPRLNYIKKKNEERAVARNVGAIAAKGLYVNFFDSDDILHDHHLQTAFDFIQKNDRPEIFHLGYDIRTTEGRTLKIFDDISDINNRIITGNLLSCNGVLVRRDVFLQNQFYPDRKLAALEDWELWIRLAAQYTIHSVREVTSSVIEHETRSVVSADVNRIKEKVECFIHLVMHNSQNLAYYGSKLMCAKASALTYASLHLAMSKASVRDVMTFLIPGIRANFRELFSRRFLATLKLMIVR